MRIFVLILLMVLWPLSGLADDKLVRLYVADALKDSGLPQYILPRFSLKTQVRIENVETPDAADLALGDTGTPLTEGLGETWYMDVRNGDHPGTQRLRDWLASDIGQRTIKSFAPDGEPLFGAPTVQTAPAQAATIDGEAEVGHNVSRAKCTRCHAVDEATRGFGIGSAPSFAVLRALTDWEQRFSVFYVLNPHPAFTQITDVTPPFPPERPSPIAPITLTLDDLGALMAYVATMQAADLGSPLAHQ